MTPPRIARLPSPRPDRPRAAPRPARPLALAFLSLALAACVDVPQRPLIDAESPVTADRGPTVDGPPPDARLDGAPPDATADPEPDAAPPEPDADLDAAPEPDADPDAAPDPEPDADRDMDPAPDMAPPDMGLPDMGRPDPLAFSGCLAVAAELPGTPGELGPPCLQVAIGTPMPVASRWQAAVALDDRRVAFVGGLIADGDGERASPRLDIYNVVTNAWVAGPALSEPRWGHVAALLPGVAAEPQRLLVAGGAENPPDLVIGGAWVTRSTGEVWRVGRATWDPPERVLPDARLLATALIDGGEMVIAGGIEAPGGALPRDVVRWRPGEQAVAGDPEQLSRGRYGHAMVEFQRGPVVIGGADEAGVAINDLESIGARGWQRYEHAGLSRVHPAAIAIADSVLIVGGRQRPFDMLDDAAIRLASSARYTRPLGQDFAPAASSPTMRRGRAMFTLSPIALLLALAVGGEGPSPDAPVIVELYDAREPNPFWWPYALPAPADVPRAFHAAATLPDGRLVVAGGRQTVDPADGPGPLLDQVLVFRISPLGDVLPGGVDPPD